MTQILSAFFYATVLMVLLFEWGHLQEITHVYEDSRLTPNATTLSFKKWNLPELNLNQWVYCSRARCSQKADYASAFGGIAPSISVFDINRDGWMDLTLTTPGQGLGLRILVNNEGEGFTDISGKVDLPTVEYKEKISVVGWADLGPEQKTHLIVGMWGCLRIFEWSYSEQKFVGETEVKNEKCGRTQGINVADLDGDGLNEVMVANFATSRGFVEPKDIQIYGDKEGGENNQVIQFDGRRFTVRDISYAKDYSWGIGLSFVNEDLRPDLLVTNDFSTDALYFSRENMEFEDVTEKWLDLAHHGYSGMNTEFGDFDGDGDMDIYISNIYSQPFYTVGNNLWLKEEGKFVYASDRFSVRKCGWSWAAKFDDFNRDGNKELLVGNGRYFGGEDESDPETKSYWYYWVNERMTPRLFRSKLMKLDFFSNTDGAEFSMAGQESSCLFEKGQDGKIRDVASSAGLDFIRVTRALALVDLNNDGLRDVIFGNFGRGYDIYINQSQPEKSWLGLNFESAQGSRTPQGVRVTLFDGQQRVQVEELFSFNGLRSQSDHRIIFPVNSEKSSEYHIGVTWPSGRKERFSNLNPERYNTVKEGRGVNLEDKP